jgi:hypothetical protein
MMCFNLVRGVCLSLHCLTFAIYGGSLLISCQPDPEGVQSISAGHRPAIFIIYRVF